MDEQVIIALGTRSLEVTALIAAPMLIGALAIGFMVSVFQAITQINEATLTFIPKMAVVAIVFVIASPWMLDVMSNFTIELFENIASYVRN